MSQAELNNRILMLQRFPPMDDEGPFQAWDAADEYLLQQTLPPAENGPLLIFNDNFGALACALSDRLVYSINDSLVSRIATQHNLQQNHLDSDNVRLLDSLAPLPAAPAAVLIKIPKTMALLERQLRALREVVIPGTLIIAGAKARDIHRATLALFEKIIGETKTSLAWKKSRLIYTSCSSSFPALAQQSGITAWPLDETSYTIHNHANVFSRGSLDIGARLFINNLPQNLDGEIADLGCGNGVIGLMALEKNPAAEVYFIDESSMAVASSRMNVEHNRPQDIPRSHFSINNSLSGFPADRFSSVLCNPPFHQQHSLTDHIALQMFHDAWRCLQYGGELRVVGNRHLGYYHKVKSIFGNCTTVASNRKFLVIKAMKLR